MQLLKGPSLQLQELDEMAKSNRSGQAAIFSPAQLQDL